MTLYAVRVGHAVDVLPGRVLDSLVWAVQPMIGRRLVGVDLGRCFRPGLHETLKRVRIGGLHSGSGNLARLAVLHAYHRSLANRPTPGPELLGVVLVPFLAANVRLINLYRPGEPVSGDSQRLPDSVGHVPSGLLSDAQVAV